MTAQELRRYFNDVYGLEKPWPKEFEVDPDTYANCCQEVFDYLWEKSNLTTLDESIRFIELSLGPNKGLIFKNIELILGK